MRSLKHLRRELPTTSSLIENVIKVTICPFGNQSGVKLSGSQAQASILHYQASK
jgi:hypothetical protein